jgi:N-acetylglucosaminyldiphosphoundecaprenol N-acetyl-beta-D-mannosaminyltransferase
MTENRINILGLPVDNLTMEETISKIDRAIIEKNQIHHVVINAAKVVNAKKDNELYESIVNCDIINADGQSIVIASKFLNIPLPERVPGIDLMFNLIELAFQKNYKIFFLGATQEILEKVITKCETKYSKKIIAGYRNGYFQPTDEEDIAKEIAASNADILFVAITSPKKEKFLNSYKNIINTPFIMGVGGSFDVFSGKVKRAPIWMQKLALEWLYRVVQEPRRMWKRYLITNTLFIFYLIKAKIQKIFK